MGEKNHLQRALLSGKRVYVTNEQVMYCLKEDTKGTLSSHLC